MKKLYIFIFTLGIGLAANGQDTFSIIAVDPATGEVGSAGASCVTGVGAMGIIDIITDIIPGRGGVNSQAYVCIPNVNLQNAIIRMEAGDDPSQIIDWLINNDACGSQNFNPEYRQYGIADLDGGGNPRTAGFTGTLCDDYKEDRQGANYSIQGNILLNQSVIDNMEDNFNNTVGTLADKLMAALQGANFPGADSRCLVDGTSSTTAYLLVYKADDDPNDPWLRLNVGQQPPGTEPIDILQGLYDDFLTVSENELLTKLRLFPNPAGEELTLSQDGSIEITSIRIYDLNGKLVLEEPRISADENEIRLNVSKLNAGVYFLNVDSPDGSASIKFVKR